MLFFSCNFWNDLLKFCLCAINAIMRLTQIKQEIYGIYMYMYILSELL